MTNYNDGKWHGWYGGECPVHPESVVEVAGGYDCAWETAAHHSKVAWENVVAFRVVKEHKEPREFWLVDACGGGFVVNHSGSCGGIHVREVLE